MNYFTQDNTEGYTNQELATMNKEVAELLNGSTDEQDIKNVCDKVANNH